MSEQEFSNLNIFLGDEGTLNYLDPRQHAPVSIVELPSSFMLSHSSFTKEDRVRFILKMASEWPLNTVKLAPISEWYKRNRHNITSDTVLIIASSGGAAVPFTVIGRRLGAKKVIVFVPKDAPMFKQMLIELAGAELRKTTEVSGDTGAELARAMIGLPNHFVFDQYQEESNPDGHCEITIDQILEQMRTASLEISGISAGVGTSGTYNAIRKSQSRNETRAIAVGIICAEKNPLPGMRPLSRLTEEQVPLAHVYKGGWRSAVERVPAYEMTKWLFSEVGLKVGLTTGGVVQGTFDFLENLKVNQSPMWDLLRNEQGERVFVGINGDLLDLYLPQLSPILDARAM